MKWVKCKSKNLRKEKTELLNDFKNNVPNETKRHRYLTRNEEIKDLSYECSKDAVSRRIIITGPFMQEKALDFAKTGVKGVKRWLGSFLKAITYKRAMMALEWLT